MKFEILLSVALAAAAATTAANAAAPDTVQLHSEQISALGIRLEQPAAGNNSLVVQASATVVIPPANEQSANAFYPGFVTRLLVAAGDPVDSGQLLAEIGSIEFLEAQRELLAAQAEAQLSREALVRDESLFTDGIIAQRRLDETRARSRLAATRVAELRQILQLGGLSTAALSALLEGGELQTTQRVYAPMSGVVLERLVQTGERTDAMDPLYRIADLSSLWLDIRVNQEDASTLQVGMPFELRSGSTIDTGLASDDVIRGEVTVIGSLVDPHTQTVSVRGVIDQSGASRQLRPDQFVQVQIFRPIESGTLSVPVEAVIHHQQASYVFVAQAGGMRAQPVLVAGYNSGRANISEGLNPDDEIAVTGIAALKALLLGSGEE